MVPGSGLFFDFILPSSSFLLRSSDITLTCIFTAFCFTPRPSSNFKGAGTWLSGIPRWVESQLRLGQLILLSLPQLGRLSQSERLHALLSGLRFLFHGLRNYGFSSDPAGFNSPAIVLFRFDLYKIFVHYFFSNPISVLFFPFDSLIPYLPAWVVLSARAVAVG